MTCRPTNEVLLCVAIPLMTSLLLTHHACSPPPSAPLEICSKADEDVTILLIGAKADLPNHLRQVSTDEARAYAEEQGWMYFETSAKEGTHVRDAFYLLACTVMNRLLEADPKNLIHNSGNVAMGKPVGQRPKGQKGGCC